MEKRTLEIGEGKECLSRVDGILLFDDHGFNKIDSEPDRERFKNYFFPRMFLC